jgi:isoquinoline 1-oxidoreductase subunit beta
MYFMNRRKFLIRSGIGLGVTVGLVWLGKFPARRYMASYLDENAPAYSGSGEIEAWFELKPDNTLTFYSPKVEMGQGILQALLQMVAEELEMDWQKIKVVQASSIHEPLDSMSTGGSLSVSGLYEPIRQLAATFREMIKENAAKLMQVEAKDLRVENGEIIGKTQKMTFGEVAAQAKEWKKPKTKPILKTPKEFKVIGKDLTRFDILPKIKGEPMFGIDASMPGMLFGSVARPPVLGATFKSAKPGKAATMPGVVKVVIEKDFAGVVAQSRIEAEDAKRYLEIEWNMPAQNVQQAEVEAMIKVGAGDSVSIQLQGSPASVLADKNSLEMEFFTPFGAHAHLEVNGALADYTADKVTIQLSTQVVKLTRDEVAKALNISQNKVEIKPMYLGGGFGRRLHTPHAIEAALLSKAVGKPVHTFWERNEEFQNGFLRPATHHKIKAKLNSQGMIEAIEHHTSSGDVAFSSPLFPQIAYTILGADGGAWRGGLIQYNVPNISVVSWRCKLPLETSWWRGLGLLANTFAIESMIDELAFRAKVDPLAFRLKHLKNDERGKRIKGVLQAVTKAANWGKTLPEGHAYGLACSIDVSTPVALIAEVKIEEGNIKVLKVYCAIDPGLIINPDGVKAQCEGGIIMSMSAAMFEEIIIKDGKATPDKLGYYQIALLKDAPEIETILLSTGATPRGVGEPPMGPVAAAVANAVFRLTNKRLNRTPLKLDKTSTNS